MSGNPYGLSGISHYGTMQRVGGKAAGFINKKFFHPSSLRNQEKLWLAQTAHETEMRKQDEMEKRREEERQVEELRKQMYLAGQANHTDIMLSGTSSSSSSSQHLTKDQKNALEEEKRRRSLLKQERASRDETLAVADAGEGADADGSDQEEVQVVALQDTDRVLAKSVYREDVYVLAHTAVWGSWYTVEDRRWGFACCKTHERSKRCPLAPPEDEEEAKEKKTERGERGARGKRRRRGRGGEGAAADADVRSTANIAASSAGGGAGAGAEPVDGEQNRRTEPEAIDAASPPAAGAD